MEEPDKPRLGLQSMLTFEEDNGSEHLCDGLRAQLRSLFPDEGANAVPQTQALGLRSPFAFQARVQAQAARPPPRPATHARE